MIKSAIKTLLLPLCVLFLFSEVEAQTPNLNQLRNQLARFDMELQRARDLIRSFDSRDAQTLLIEAENLRNQVADILNSNNPPRDRLADAIRLLIEARLRLEKAVKFALDPTINRWRSRLEQLLQQAEQDVISNNQKEAERLLQLARQSRDAADQALANGEGFKALEHLRVAVKLAEQALDLNTRKLDSFQEERQRFEILRERAREVVERTSDSRARIIFNQANKMAESALQAEQNRNAQLSRKFYNQGILLLLRAMDMAKGQTPEAADHADVEIARLRDTINNSSELVQSGPPRAQLVLERARRFAAEAELAVKEGRSSEAIWKIELAENLVNRARRMSGNRGDRKFANRITEEIENTHSDIVDMRADLALESSPDAEILVNMADLAITKAEQASASGLERFALEAVLAAQRFLTKAERILNRQDTNGFSRERVQARLTQLDDAIAEAESQVSSANDEWTRRLFLSAKDFRQLAGEALEKGNYLAADEVIQVAFDLLRKSLKNLPKN
jgi:hypothetical protein